MGFGPEVHGRARAPRISAVCRSALALVSVVALIAVAGCGTKRAKQTSSTTRHGADSSATASAGAKHEAKAGAAGHAPGPAGPTGSTNRVRLTQHTCIQFDPQWCDIALGKPLIFYSELKAPVTIHVSGGAFAKTEFVVRPGATVSTGPAHATGSYSLWSEPAACQGAPLGARGSGPGVTVEGAAAQK
jgi:hypothetical protein